MSEQISYSGILHASVVVADVARALAFYRDVLGLEIDPDRPALSFPGAWLQIGRQQIHLMQVAPSGPVAAERTQYAGRDPHTAIGVNDLAALSARLDNAGVAYTEASSGRRIFCRDPDGNTLEIVENG